MYQIAKSSRTKLKNKARQMASASDQKVDSSDWTPAEPLNADIKTGMRPVSRRAFKKGGKVMGECAEPRADRKPRKSGGRMVAKDIAEAKINRNVKEANELRPGGKAHVGGMKKGGAAKRGKYATDGSVQVKGAKPDYKIQQRMNAAPSKSDAEMDISKMPQPSDMYDEEQVKRLERGYKKGGATKKMIGGPMMGANVKSKRMEFAGNPVTPGQKRGGKVEKHEDEAMDKALIRKMVKPSARKGKADGGESMLTGLGPMIGTADEDAAVKGMLGIAAGKKSGGRTKHPARAGKTHGGGSLSPEDKHSIRANIAGSNRQAMEESGGEGRVYGSDEGLADYLNATRRIDKYKSDNQQVDLKRGGRTKRATGGQVFSGPGYPGKIPGVVPGGRTARKAGGKTGKTNINIVIGGPKGDDMGMPPKGLPPQLPQRMPVPAPAPAPGGMPPMAAVGPAAMPPMPLPPPPGGAPMARKAGGRITKVASSYKDMEAGAGGGEGRLQKTDIAKKGKGAPTFKRGGKVYRSYKDMDAGAGSGEGRLEKSEIQHTKRVH